jgi:hypothetical protein
MPVKITFDKSRCVTRITNTFNSNMGLLASEVLNDCNQYCKEDTGALIASSQIHSDLKAGKLVWQTPYARRQYWEIRTAYTDTNPGARWKWAHYAKSKLMRKWERQAQRLMEMNL